MDPPLQAPRIGLNKVTGCQWHMGKEDRQTNSERRKVTGHTSLDELSSPGSHQGQEAEVPSPC
jgi:hypothetical protein